MHRFSPAYHYLSNIWPPEPAEVFYGLSTGWCSFSHWIVPGTIEDDA
jgi:hypothetical protein